MSGSRGSAPVLLTAFLLVLVVALAAALVLSTRANGQHTTATQATVVALRTAVADAAARAGARGTEVARLQQQLAQLERAASVTATPTATGNGQHSYIASFQSGGYTYTLFMQWTESNGFLHDGRLRTADNYARETSRSFPLSGVDNDGSYGFTAGDKNAPMTFTGTANADGSFTVSGVPWSVFFGFVGETFTRQLHRGTLQDFNAAVADLARSAT